MWSKPPFQPPTGCLLNISTSAEWWGFIPQLAAILSKRWGMLWTRKLLVLLGFIDKMRTRKEHSLFDLVLHVYWAIPPIRYVYIRLGLPLITTYLLVASDDKVSPFDNCSHADISTPWAKKCGAWIMKMVWRAAGCIYCKVRCVQRFRWWNQVD